MTRTRYKLMLLLIIVVVLAFWRVTQNGFIPYDDGPYVQRNSHVQSGLTLRGLVWAFTTTTENNWHPLTWISHMLDWEIFGDRVGGHHAVSLLLHLLNTVLLFLLLEYMTGSTWRSAFVAGLFGVHPLHVESVAWVAERKDVLSTFFGMLAFVAYVCYATRKEHGSKSGFAYFAVIVAYALSLMSKPMLVTFPFVLLLLDYWPLGRFRKCTGRPGCSAVEHRKDYGTSMRYSRLLFEKIPLVAMSLASCVMTYVVQREALSSFDRIPLGVRLGNAVVAYVTYVYRMFNPRNLAVFYPYPTSGLGVWNVVASLVVILGVSYYSLRVRRSRPYFPVGWFWYLGTLIPVIGLVQVGAQATADRYTYIPLIGLFIVLGWSLPVNRYVYGIAIVALGVCTSIQVSYWRDGITLFRRAITVTEGNYLAHNNLGAALEEAGRLEEAALHYSRTISLRPDDALAYNNLGNVCTRLGRLRDAAKHYQRALELMPKNAAIRNNLGLVLFRQGRLDEAESQYRTAISLKPDYAEAHLNLGILLVQKGLFDEAVKHLLKASSGQRAVASEAHNNIGVVLAHQNQTERAIEEFSEAIRLRHSNVEAHQNLALAYFMSGRYQEAWQEVHVCRKYGRELHPQFLRALAQRMPEPMRSP